jgi:hypothetical protein
MLGIMRDESLDMMVRLVGRHGRQRSAMRSLPAVERYRLIGYQPHVRRNGRKTRLAVWLGFCVECGWSFTCNSPENAPPHRKYTERRAGRASRKPQERMPPHILRQR